MRKAQGKKQQKNKDLHKIGEDIRDSSWEAGVVDGKSRGRTVRIPTRAQAIKIFCYECNGTQRFTLETDCLGKNCSLYPYRPGNNLPGLRKRVRRGKA